MGQTSRNLLQGGVFLAGFPDAGAGRIGALTLPFKLVEESTVEWHRLSATSEKWVGRCVSSFALAVLIGVCAQAVAQQQENYTLQPGDSLEVSVLQDPTLNRRVVVAPDGMISFPLVGHIRAAGMTTQALEGLLSKRLRKNYQTDPQVTVMLSEVKVRAGFPGIRNRRSEQTWELPDKPGTSVMQAIALSGGLSQFAAKSRIQIHRKVARQRTGVSF